MDNVFTLDAIRTAVEDILTIEPTYGDTEYTIAKLEGKKEVASDILALLNESAEVVEPDFR